MTAAWSEYDENLERAMGVVAKTTDTEELQRIIKAREDANAAKSNGLQVTADAAPNKAIIGMVVDGESGLLIRQGQVVVTNISRHALPTGVTLNGERVDVKWTKSGGGGPNESEPIEVPIDMASVTVELAAGSNAETTTGLQRGNVDFSVARSGSQVAVKIADRPVGRGYCVVTIRW